MAFLGHNWTHRHIIVVHEDDLETAREASVEVAREALGATDAEADRERGGFVPVPGLPGFWWLNTASSPAIRAAVQKRLRRFTRDVYFAWLDRDGRPVAGKDGLEAGRLNPGTGQLRRGRSGEIQAGRKLRPAETIAHVRELFS